MTEEMRVDRVSLGMWVREVGDDGPFREVFKISWEQDSDDVRLHVYTAKGRALYDALPDLPRHTMVEVTKEPAGWAYPVVPNVRKMHWWAVEEDRSGCGKYGRMGAKIYAKHPGEGACVACDWKAARS